MPTRPTLESARQRLFRVQQRFWEALADRVIVREPSEARQQYAEKRARELGLAEKAERVRRSE